MMIETKVKERSVTPRVAEHMRSAAEVGAGGTWGGCADCGPLQIGRAAAGVALAGEDSAALACAEC